MDNFDLTANPDACQFAFTVEKDGKTMDKMRQEVQNGLAFMTYAPILFISAKTGQGLDALEAAIRQAVDIPEIHEADVVITSARQYDLLTAAAQELQRVVDGLQSDLPSDLVAEDLRMVLDTLGDATGVERITPQATLNNIFSSFCIGK